MPELPEAEFCARRLREWAAGRRILTVSAAAGRPLDGQTPEDFADALVDFEVRTVRRHGKQLIVDLVGDADTGPLEAALLVHLGMTGKWVRGPEAGTLTRGARVRLTLSDGVHLDFVDPRRFGRLRVVPADALGALDPARPFEALGLGPDAWVVAREARLGERLAWRKSPIKPTLLDQRALAGVGNIYAVEALHRAGVHPARRCDSLSDGAFEGLAAALDAVFAASLAREVGEEIAYLSGGGAENPFSVYGRAGQPCPQCAAPIVRVEQSGRGTFFCAVCQPA